MHIIYVRTLSLFSSSLNEVQLLQSLSLALTGIFKGVKSEYGHYS